MRTILLFHIFCITFFMCFSQQKEICITLDDLPVVSYDFKDIEFQQSIIDKLVATFDEYGIPAIGFVNEGKLHKNGKPDVQQVELLKTWLAAGYELGNHTYSHQSYHRISFDAYTADILE